MKATNRTFTDVENGIEFRLYMHDQTHEYALIYDGGTKSTDYAKGTEINGFYISAHTDQQIKINGEKLIKLNTGQFYNMKEGEVVTHKKYAGFKRFTKI